MYPQVDAKIKVFTVNKNKVKRNNVKLRNFKDK